MGRAFEYRRAAKEKRWDTMSRVFPRLAKQITVAAKDGGTDPNSNPKLRTAILNAKAQNMPKDNIENAIKRATGKDASQIQEITYEGKAPHGVLIFIECATDNQTRTIANIKAYFNKYSEKFNASATLVPNGSLEFLFSRKSSFEIEKDPKVKLEELELELIDFGLEELMTEGEMIYIYGDYSNFGELSAALENKGVSVKKASLKRIPTSPIELTEEQVANVEKLIDRIEEDEDVIAVYTNIL